MEAILFMGIPGAGKSTFYKERFFDTHVRINLDLLHTRHREALLLRACIEGKQSFVVDNTNPTVEDRSRYILPAKSADFRIIVYYIAASIQEALDRNALRTAKQRVPDVGIRAIRNRMQLPTLSEGIDERYYVTMGEERSFNVEAFRDDVGRTPDRTIR